MATSRIVFAIGDLVAEVKRLVPGADKVPIEVRLDEVTFCAVVGEIENHYGQVLPRSEFVEVGEAAVEFGGMRIVTELGKPSG